jgi:hypothetical protein
VFGVLGTYLTVKLCNDFRETGWDFERTIDGWTSKGAHFLFLESYSIEIMLSPVSKSLLALLAFSTRVCSTLVSTIPEALLLNSAFCMLDTVKNFRDKFDQKMHPMEVKHIRSVSIQPCVIRRPLTSYVSQILREFEALKVLSKRMNVAVGVSVFGYVLGGLPYVVYTFVELAQPNEPFTFIRRLLMFSNYFGFIVMAILVNKKVSQMNLSNEI